MVFSNIVKSGVNVRPGFFTTVWRILTGPRRCRSVYHMYRTDIRCEKRRGHGDLHASRYLIWLWRSKNECDIYRGRSVPE